MCTNIYIFNLKPEKWLFSLFYTKYDLIFLVFNATFSNISDISWRPVLVVEDVGVPGESHRP
jgi:hypothetical protein